MPVESALPCGCLIDRVKDIHTKLSPHFTTGTERKTDRYSLEIRLWARTDAFLKYHDPAIYIGRRDGLPMIVGTRCLAPGVHRFLAAALLAAAPTV
jgi:hypothetical protein